MRHDFPSRDGLYPPNSKPDRKMFLQTSISIVHPGATVDIVRVEGNYEETMDRVRVQLMSGSAPTIMQASLFGFPTMPNFDYFSDWMPLMEAHPGFVEAGWHMNILDAFRLNGKLVGFPAAAANSYVLANKNVPGLVEAFEGRSSVSFQELVELYHLYYEDSGGLYFSDGTVNYYFRNFLLHRFFDYESRKVLFDSREFVDIISELVEILPGSWSENNEDPFAFDSLMGVSNMFMFLNGSWDPFYFLISPQKLA